jgi:hypothetical protein
MLYVIVYGRLQRMSTAGASWGSPGSAYWQPVLWYGFHVLNVMVATAPSILMIPAGPGGGTIVMLIVAVGSSGVVGGGLVGGGVTGGLVGGVVTGGEVGGVVTGGLVGGTVTVGEVVVGATVVVGDGFGVASGTPATVTYVDAVDRPCAPIATHVTL